MKSKWMALSCAMVLAGAASAAPTAATAPLQPQKIADGVWAVATAGGANAGWFLLGNSVVAVDSGKDVNDAAALLQAIRDSAGKPVSYLILTSDFAPHAGGASVFANAGAKVVCQQNFYPLFASSLLNVADSSGLMLAVGNRLVLASKDRVALVEFTGPADSGGDLVVYLPKEKVLFTGDLVETGPLPPLFSKEIDVKGWRSALETMRKFPVDQLVPGYGAIGPAVGLEATRNYLENVDAITARLMAEKITEEQLAKRLKNADVAVKGLPSQLAEPSQKNLAAVMRTLIERAKAKKTPGSKPDAGR